MGDVEIMITRALWTMALLFSFPCHSVIRGEEVVDSDPLARSAVALIGRNTIYGNLEIPYYCTGTLIRADVIVTAAHCLLDEKGVPMPLARLTVSFGLHGSFALSGANIRAVEDFKVHPDFKPSITLGETLNDIALVRIQPAPDGYLPARLAEGTPALAAGDEVQFGGFGITELNDRLMQSAGILHKATAQFSYFDRSGTGIILSNQTALSCFGDSGGPAYSLDRDGVIVLGVTSHGEGNGCAGDQVYTSVAAHRQFIESTLNSRWHESSNPGAVPNTEWARGCLELDENGFVVCNKSGSDRRWCRRFILIWGMAEVIVGRPKCDFRE